MRTLLIVFFTAIGFLPSYVFAAKPLSEAESTELREERTINAFDIFRKVCLADYKNLDGRQKFLEENYFPASEKRTAEKLAFVQAKSGTVWNTSRAQERSYSVVADEGGNCHVIADKISAEKLHKQLKELALDTKDSMTFSVIDYKGVAEGQAIQNSHYDVKDPDGSVYFSVYAATKENKGAPDAEGVISLIAPRKP